MDLRDLAGVSFALGADFQSDLTAQTRRTPDLSAPRAGTLTIPKLTGRVRFPPPVHLRNGQQSTWPLLVAALIVPKHV
jgi:hypothetical protein